MKPDKSPEPLPSASGSGSDASACDWRIAKPKEQWCLKGHSAICDTLCKLWCCKHEHQEALLAPRPNDPSSATRRTGRTDCNRDAHAGFAAAHG